MRLIDADALCRWLSDWQLTEQDNYEVWQVIDETIKVIINAPTIDAPHTETMIVHGEEIEVDPLSYEIGYTNGQMAEEVHGKWESRTEDDDGLYEFCSVCGSDVDITHYGQSYNYCPNCGAKMDGGNEE